ncbi:MAG: hypothetical protein KDE31_00410, partial [Caldilineaceae bacterium]|nr:hypothetical protein [Caldilineaceae bacterium]
EIIEKQIAEKPATCVPSESGVHSIPVPEERSAAPSVSDTMATSIAKMGLDIDRIFGCRVDIEWAVADDEIQIVQVRPITALPSFFPHHLPPHLAAERWEPLWPYWYFPNNQIEGKVVPPLYQDLSYAEMFVRYQVGPIDLHNGRFSGLEMDFHGHCYHIAEPRSSQAKPSLAELEAYLQEYEPALRQQWLDVKHHQFPAVTAKVVELQQGANSLKELIDALLWARDTGFDLGCQTIGPPQCLFGVCITLFDNFLAHHLPDLNADALKQGHHPELEPYYPHVQTQEAETLATSFVQDSIRQIFETMDDPSLFQYLIEHRDSLPFAHAYNGYAERLGLVPLDWQDEIRPDEKAIHYAALQVIRDLFLGNGGGVAKNNEQVRQRRSECEAQFRQALMKHEPAILARFERLLDWLYFWAPALNDRGWAVVPHYPFRRLWMTLCRKLQALGLIDTPADIGYFTTEDLAYMAGTGDIEEGRRIWQRRRLEYERQDRLQPPSSLGKVSAKSAAKPQGNDGTTKESMPPAVKNAKTVIHGRGHSAGRASGIAHKIETLGESDTTTDQHILILTKPIQPTSQYSALLLSLILRVQGIIVVQAGQTYTHHIAQIARECGVPVLEISPDNLDHIPARAELMVDGSAGTVMIVR